MATSECRPESGAPGMDFHKAHSEGALARSGGLATAVAPARRPRDRASHQRTKISSVTDRTMKGAPLAHRLQAAALGFCCDHGSGTAHGRRLVGETARAHLARTRLGVPRRGPEGVRSPPNDGDVISLKDGRDRLHWERDLTTRSSQIVARRFRAGNRSSISISSSAGLPQAIECSRADGIEPRLCRLVWSESDGLPG